MFPGHSAVPTALTRAIDLFRSDESLGYSHVVPTGRYTRMYPQATALRPEGRLFPSALPGGVLFGLPVPGDESPGYSRSA